MNETYVNFNAHLADLIEELKYQRMLYVMGDISYTKLKEKVTQLIETFQKETTS